jgi:hypothetical protein
VDLLLSRTARSESEVQAWRRLISTTAGYPGRLPEPELLGLADLKVGRLYPAHPDRLPRRARVDDAPMVPRLAMWSDSDYGRALTRYWRLCGSGFLLLEWDIAIDTAAYLQMAAYVYSAPEAVWAAPYALYPPPHALGLPSQVPAAETADAEGRVPFVPLGCTYLPGWVLRAMAESGFDAAMAFPNPDHQFNHWANSVGIERRLAYYVRPIHLHYGA